VDHPDINELLTSENWMVRAQAAIDEALSAEQVEALLTDQNETVRTIAADMHREVSEAVILRVIEKYPQDMLHFTLHASAPGIVLGHRALNWVGKPDLERYLNYQNATDSQWARMTELWTITSDRMTTLVDLWTEVVGDGN
jgi:HEAT repeat protein